VHHHRAFSDIARPLNTARVYRPTASTSEYPENSAREIVEFEERKRRNDVKMNDSGGGGEVSGRELSRRENRVKEEQAE